MPAARTATPALALTTAAALAFTPFMTPLPMAARDLTVPHISTPRLQLTAVINPADIAKLVDNLESAMASASTTVTGLVGAPGQTLTQALTSAVTLNDSLWNGLIAATDNKTLTAILKTLKASAGNGLSDLSKSIDDVNGSIVLTTGQLADLLTSTLTGSLGTALNAVATVINNPLALPSYTGLINAPIDIAGLALTQGIGTVNHLGANVLTVTNTVVTGVTRQVSNALDTFNGLLDASKKLTGIDLVNGLITAVQGIVSAPVAAAVAAVNGASTTITNAATTILDRVTDGASDAVATWIGNGTDPGAIQKVINTIGTAPLSPATYAHAISVLVGAGTSTLTTAAHTVGSLASVPFTAGADITVAAANVFTAFTSGLATAASGILQAAGLPSLVTGIPHAMATTVNLLVKAAATTTAAGLRTIAAALDFGSAITGSLTATAAPAATHKTVTLSLTADTTPSTDTTAANTTTGRGPKTAAAEPKTANAAEPTDPAEDTASEAAEPTVNPATEESPNPTPAAEAAAATDATASTAASTATDAKTEAADDSKGASASTKDRTTTSTADKDDTTTSAGAANGASNPDKTDNVTAPKKPRPSGTKNTNGDKTSGSAPGKTASTSPNNGPSDGTSAATAKTPKHASATSPRHAAASDSAPKHAAAA
ncbi:hypothetical protein LIX17_25855 (plasmid) [Mycobacterium avium subsp. hominissuis]|uniref:hypothetical protein n=1 Tax=Mycobacterium avium TaxID=1764 RepID=UPI00313FEA42